MRHDHPRSKQSGKPGQGHYHILYLVDNNNTYRYDNLVGDPIGGDNPYDMGSDRMFELRQKAGVDLPGLIPSLWQEVFAGSNLVTDEVSFEPVP